MKLGTYGMGCTFGGTPDSPDRASSVPMPERENALALERALGLWAAAEEESEGTIRALGAKGLSASGGGVGRYSVEVLRAEPGPGDMGGMDVGVLAVGEVVGEPGWGERVGELPMVSPARPLWIVCGVGGGGGWYGRTPRSPLT